MVGRDSQLDLVPSMLAGNHAVVGPDLMPEMDAAREFYATSAFDAGGQYFTQERIGANMGWFMDTNGLLIGIRFEPVIP